MTTNRSVFARDPLTMTIPNDGVAKVVEPSSPDEWDVLQFELQTFVCAGEYERGLDRILETYLRHLSEPTQPAVWVSGFYGSGKSHLVRVLEYLWRDTALPGGARARALVELPQGIKEHLRELTTVSRRYGGLWSAAGTLNASGAGSVRLALLGIVLRSADLPTQYPQARFVLWLKQSGVYEQFVAEIAAADRQLSYELDNMYVSPYITRALRAVFPDLATSDADARTQLRVQYPNVTDIGNDQMLDMLREVLGWQSSDATKLPCTLVVLDELQQYIGDSDERARDVQEVVEACSSRLGGVLLFVATGQSALQGTPQLQRIQGRFRVTVPLSNTDVEQVVRSVALRKDPNHIAALRSVLSATSGEIDRQLHGTRIAPRADDANVIAEDYPLLPARQRFWEAALRTVDRSGVQGQLRSQLRIAFEAARSVANAPLGTVVGGDFLYEQIGTNMLESGMILADEYRAIAGEATLGGPDAALRERACATIYLINKLASSGGVETGLRATVDTLADLLVTDLTQGSTALRQHLPGVLDVMAARGVLTRVGDEYRLQTREGAAWEGEYSATLARIGNDAPRIAEERAGVLRAKMTSELRSILVFTQGESKTKRTLEPAFGGEAPAATGSAVPLWVRDEWGTSAKIAQEDARALGTDSPVITLFLPRPDGDELRRILAQQIAVSDTLASRGVAATEAGRVAQLAMESRKARLVEERDRAVGAMLREARVFQGGGNEISGASSLTAAVREAAEAALQRLYPQFKEADHAKWDRVGKQAQEGNPSALKQVDYNGEVAQHPVCKRVLEAAGASGKLGRAVRQFFSEPPYGWPQDATDAALRVLVANGELRASKNGIPMSVKELDGSAISLTEFRRETTPLTTGQKLAVRSLLQEAGMPAPSNADEATLATAAQTMLREMRALAQSAGGASPRPLPPDAAYLDELTTLVGNELLRAVYEARERLKADRAAWTARREAIAKRVPRWEMLRQLLDVAATLPITAETQTVMEAISANRALLDDPDPVPPLAAALTGALRAALSEAYAHYEAQFTAEMTKIEQSDEWGRLAEDDRARLTARSGLHRVPAPNVGSEADILRSLGGTPLGAWRDRTAALTTQFAAVRGEAIQLLLPKAVHVTLPQRTLTTEAEMDAYLAAAREAILAHIEQGTPVIV